jgi:hypothetical protein
MNNGNLSIPTATRQGSTATTATYTAGCKNTTAIMDDFRLAAWLRCETCKTEIRT